MADLRVHSDRIAVMPIEDRVSSGGILKPQGSVKREIPVLRGQVVVTGPGQMLENGQYSGMPVGPGDTVQYLGAHTVEVTIHGVKYHIIDLSTLICVETEDKNRDREQLCPKQATGHMAIFLPGPGRNKAPTNPSANPKIVPHKIPNGQEQAQKLPDGFMKESDVPGKFFEDNGQEQAQKLSDEFMKEEDDDGNL